jgi:PAS domain S-box-containing protein
MPARGTRDFFFEVFESGILTILLLIAVFAFRVNSLKNRYLTAEIQERELAEKKLATREDQLSKLVGNLPGMVYQCLYDENWTIKIISQACKQITGYSPDDLIDNKVISFNDLILPEYQQPIRMKWQKCIAQNEPFEYEYPIRSASGDIKWVWERGNALFDEKGKVSHLEGYIADITTKKQGRNKIKESEDNFFRSMEESPIGMRIISPDSHTESPIRTPENF